MDVLHTEARRNEHALIVARYPLHSYLNFVSSRCIAGAETHERLLTQEWREMQQRASEADATEYGLVDQHAFVPLPDEMIPLAQEARNSEATQKIFSMLSFQWWLIEIDKLVVFQPWIDLSYVREMQAALPSTLTHEDHIRMAAGSFVVKPQVFGSSLPDGRFTFISPSTDVRFLGSALLDPSSVNHQSNGNATHVVAIFVGSSVNCLSALRVNDRLILLNGSHRAYALRDLGFTHVACLVVDLMNEEEKARMIPSAVRKDEARYLTARRPPLFKDYFDPRFRKVLPTVGNSTILRLKLDESTETVRTS